LIRFLSHPSPSGFSLASASVLVVCSKLETGYDDPHLALLFVDRPLRGARAVQTLGRLNRPAPWLNKTSRSIHVFDFVNPPSALRDAFAEYFGETVLYVGPRAVLRRRTQEMERVRRARQGGMSPFSIFISPTLTLRKCQGAYKSYLYPFFLSSY
jgi:superfamily II DNA or RNA helicase